MEHPYTYMKKCKYCNQEKNLSEFHPSPKTKDRVMSFCKDCFSKKCERKLRNYCSAGHPQDIYRKRHKGGGSYCWMCKKLANKKERKDNPERNRYYTRKYRYKNVYGITFEERETILSKQGGRCAICETDLSNPDDNSHIDHCHVSGIVRGILCCKCNVGLGYFNDNQELLRKAIKYLNKGVSI